MVSLLELPHGDVEDHLSVSMVPNNEAPIIQVDRDGVVPQVTGSKIDVGPMALGVLAPGIP